MKEFEVYTILGDVRTEPLWTWNEWVKVYPALAAVVVEVDGPATSYVTQNKPELASSESFEWSESGHQAWTYGSPITKEESSGWTFRSMELWSPNREQCDKLNRPPGLFFAFRNEQALFSGQTRFNPYVVLAVRADVDTDTTNKARKAAILIADKVQAVLRARTRRPWGIPFGTNAYTNAIGDLMTVDVFRVGEAHRTIPTLECLEGQWERF
jgi:hypothetical protein